MRDVYKIVHAMRMQTLPLFVYLQGGFKVKISTKNLTTSSMLCAVSYILMLVSKIIPQVSGFLQFDAKDVAIAIGGFLLGTPYALLISLVVSFLEFLSVSDTGIIGFIMNFISTAAFCCTASIIYNRYKKISSAVAGLVAATVVLTVIMLLWNYYITPMYMKIPRSVVASMLPTVFLPFNLVKGFINSGLILIVYRPVVDTLRRAGLVEKTNTTKKKLSISVIIGLALLAIFIPIFMTLI